MALLNEHVELGSINYANEKVGAQLVGLVAMRYLSFFVVLFYAMIYAVIYISTMSR